MDVRELKEILKDLPDNLPIVGWHGVKREPTEQVEFHRGPARWPDGSFAFEDALQVHVE